MKCEISGLVGWFFLAGSVAFAAPAVGPLRVHPNNPRYFTDDGRRAVLVTGAHTWNNLVDMGRNDPPEPFNFAGYLAALERDGHNFIRLWAWDSVTWDTRANGRLGKDFVHFVAPLPWARTGPGNALDGKPKFNLLQFNEAYFERLRARVRAAGDRGIYVSVMLFEGWGLRHGNRGRAAPAGWAWQGHPFNPANNVNDLGIKVAGDGLSGEVHALGNEKVNTMQAAYIRRVVDTVNGLDNVLYEVINEGGEKEWDWWVVKTIKEYEAAKPKKHPVGITGHGAERLADMLASPADWISPGQIDGFGEDPPAWNTNKASLLDTDHIWGVGGNPAWVWRSLLRGHNPIFMDPYDGSVLGAAADARWVALRRALGFARKVTLRVNLAGLRPQNDLASTAYCLAETGREYLVYQPKPGEVFTVQLQAGNYRREWFDPATGDFSPSERLAVARPAQEFKAPFAGDALLYLIAD